MVKNDSTLIIEEKLLVRRSTITDRLAYIRTLPWHKRVFRTMQDGSMRRVVLMWIGMCMGTSNLAIPYFFAQLGLFPAIFLVVLSAYLNLKMCTYINEMSIATNSNNFYALVEKAVPRFFFVIFKYSLFLDIMATMMSISVVVWNLFEYIIFCLGIGKEHWNEWILDMDTFEVDESHPTVIVARGIFYLVLYVTMVRLFFKKSMGPLGIFLQLSVYMTIVVILFTLIDVPFFLRGYRNENIEVHYYKPISFTWIDGFYGFCFCYYVQPYLISLRNELAVPTHQRMVKTMSYGFLSQAIMYVTLGTSAYICLGDKLTPEIITTRKAYMGRDPLWEATYRLVTIGYFISNSFCLASYSPTLEICMRAFLKIKNKNRRRFVLSTFPFTVTIILSFVFPNIIKLINLCGPTLFNYNGYIIPILMKIKLVKDSKGTFKQLSIYYAVLGILIFTMSYGMISPILELFKPKK